MLLSYTEDVSKHAEELVDAVLTTLANIAMLNDWHQEFIPSLDGLFSLLDQISLPIRLQCLKVLVNLSTNEDMIAPMMAAKPPSKLQYLMDVSEEREIVLRLVTLLANLAKSKASVESDPPKEESLYGIVFSSDKVADFQDKAKALANQFDDEDVRYQARKLFNALKPAEEPATTSA